MFGSCRVRETKRENVHASSYRCGIWVAWTQPLAVHKFKTYLLFNLHSSCGSAERKSSGLSLSFHIKEGVAMQPSLPAADWGETGKQTESGGRRVDLLLHMSDFETIISLFIPYFSCMLKDLPSYYCSYYCYLWVNGQIKAINTTGRQKQKYPPTY